MMRKCVLFVLGTLSLTIASSQVRSYKFSQKDETFSVLKNATIVLSDSFWIDNNFEETGYTIGNKERFTFPFLDEKISDIIISLQEAPKTAGSSVYLRGDSIQLYFQVGTFRIKEYSNKLPFQTKISYLIDSTNFNTKIFKIEFLNLGVADSVYNTVGEVNLQIWLYDNGTVEYHYGNSSVPSNVYFFKNKKYYNGMLAYIYKSNYEFCQGVYVYGNPQNASVYYMDSCSGFAIYKDSGLYYFPSNMVHTFSRKDLNTNDIKINSKLKFYPNPSAGKLYFDGTEFKNAKVKIYNLQGCEKINGVIDNNEFDVNNIGKGIYFIIVEKEESRFTNTFIRE